MVSVSDCHKSVTPRRLTSGMEVSRLEKQRNVLFSFERGFFMFWCEFIRKKGLWKRLYCLVFSVCMLFVFLALLEFAIVNSYMRKSEKFEQMAKKIQLGIIRKSKICVMILPSNMSRIAKWELEQSRGKDNFERSWPRGEEDGLPVYRRVEQDKCPGALCRWVVFGLL